MQRGKIAVIGGGMSGMLSAILLAEAGFRVVLLERQDRIGKKLLLTGNGRCNLTNVVMNTSFYRTDAPEMLEQILSILPFSEEKSFWERIGCSLREVRGYYYPVTNQASTILDCLRFRIEELKIDVRTQACCEQIRGRSGSFLIQWKNADGLTQAEGGFERILLCCGGLAGVYKEAAVNGYALAAGMQHTVRTGHPALVAVVCSEDMKSIAGIRMQARVSLLHRDRCIGSEEGELQLTKEGISGIPVFQLTRYLDGFKNYRFEADLLPFLAEDSLHEILKSRSGKMTERNMEQFFAGWLQKKMILYLLKRFGMPAGKKVKDVPLSQMIDLATDMKHCIFTPEALGDYRQAQVSVGGIPLEEVSSYMESRKVPGIHITGEMLDVTGACGGYNLHFAAATAFAAVKGITYGK